MTDIIKGAIQLLRSHNCPVLDPFPIFEKETDPPPFPPPPLRRPAEFELEKNAMIDKTILIEYNWVKTELNKLHKYNFFGNTSFIVT